MYSKIVLICKIDTGLLTRDFRYDCTNFMLSVSLYLWFSTTINLSFLCQIIKLAIQILNSRYLGLEVFKSFNLSLPCLLFNVLFIILNCSTTLNKIYCMHLKPFYFIYLNLKIYWYWNKIVDIFVNLKGPKKAYHIFQISS